jgi:4-hydroxy-2-oxoheptanedioate aldolase
MKPNKIKQLWAQGKPVTLGWISIANSFTAEIMARQGFDAVCVDMQHGVTDLANLMEMLQAVSATEELLLFVLVGMSLLPS